MYAEAQRRAGDYKEFGAALAALMFNVFQLLRTIMATVQLNAFVAWSEHATECLYALLGKEREAKEKVSCGFLRMKILVIWCKRRIARICGCMRGNTDNREPTSTPDEENIELPCGSDISDESYYEDEDIEEEIKVNNTVVDNELGGREVTVLPSWKKVWDGLKKGSLTPSRWLQTDQVMVNTVRWSGAYLCGMGEQWSVDRYNSEYSRAMVEKFFSENMLAMHDIFQHVEWNVGAENGGRELMSVFGIAGHGWTNLAGEMSTAYGDDVDFYCFCGSDSVKLFSFEFNNLVCSYPAKTEKNENGNRGSVKVELVHSVVLAKHLGVEKLKAIRQYYDRYRVPSGFIRENAFRLLQKQTRCSIPDDDNIWWMFRSGYYKIPLFPYRMQAVALWDEATNWRVLQASAHRDIKNSLSQRPIIMRNEEKVLRNTPHRVNIFHHCAEWSKKHNYNKRSLGVVIETVRTFLAEWITESRAVPMWEPEFPRDCFEFDLGESSWKRYGCYRPNVTDMYPQRQLIWICQRELQRKVARMRNKSENFSGSPSLIMLFLLGFPHLSMEAGAQENQEAQEATPASSSNRNSMRPMFGDSWRVWTVLAPQDISLMLQLDFANDTMSLSLRNDSGDTRFVWQDWIDAAMGCLKGYEEDQKSESRYGRTVLRGDLQRPMVELCPLRVNGYGLGATVERTRTARIWMGWPPFDVRICQFELNQWLASCDVNLNRARDREERWTVMDEVTTVEEVIEKIKSEEKEKTEKSVQSDKD